MCSSDCVHCSVVSVQDNQQPCNFIIYTCFKAKLVESSKCGCPMGSFVMNYDSRAKKKRWNTNLLRHKMVFVCVPYCLTTWFLNKKAVQQSKTKCSPNCCRDWPQRGRRISFRPPATESSMERARPAAAPVKEGS